MTELREKIQRALIIIERVGKTAAAQGIAVPRPMTAREIEREYTRQGYRITASRHYVTASFKFDGKGEYEDCSMSSTSTVDPRHMVEVATLAQAADRELRGLDPAPYVMLGTFMVEGFVFSVERCDPLVTIAEVGTRSDPHSAEPVSAEVSQVDGAWDWTEEVDGLTHWLGADVSAAVLAYLNEHGLP